MTVPGYKPTWHARPVAFARRRQAGIEVRFARFAQRISDRDTGNPTDRVTVAGRVFAPENLHSERCRGRISDMAGAAAAGWGFLFRNLL